MRYVKQDTPYLQGHFDYFNGTGAPKEPKDKAYMSGFNAARKKGMTMIKKKEKSRRKVK